MYWENDNVKMKYIMNQSKIGVIMRLMNVINLNFCIWSVFIKIYFIVFYLCIEFFLEDFKIYNIRIEN